MRRVGAGGISPRGRRPGARSALLLIGILLIGANLRTGITSVGPVLGDIRMDLGLSGASASLLVVIPLIAFSLFSPVAPLLAAKFGMERTLGAALLLLAVAIVTRSIPFTGAIWIGTVLLGVAVALMNVILPSLIKRDYPGAVGKVTGLYSAVQSASAALASGFAVPLAGTGQEGWRLALGIWAGFALIAFAVFLPQLHRRTLPINGPATEATPGTAADADRTPQRHRSPWGSALAWQVTLFMGLQSTVYYTVINWWPSMEQDHGVSAAAAGWHQFAFQLFGIIGNLACAFAIHRFRDQRIIAVTASGLLIAGILGQLLAPNFSLAWILLTGIGCGASIVLALSLFGLRTGNHRQAAALSGMAQSVGYLIAAAGPVLVGVLHDATGDWTAPLVALLGVVVLQLVLGILAGRNRLLGMRPV